MQNLTPREEGKKVKQADSDPVEICESLNVRYRETRKLGTGATSTVWLCLDRQIKQFVAIKLMKSGFTSIAEEEIKFLKCTGDKNIDDPHKDKVIQLLDSFNISGLNGTQSCLVFEAMGDNLSEIIVKTKHCGIPLPTVKSIIKQVLESLNYLHTKCKIIHTDVKPENFFICLDKDPLSIKIADLGYACWANQQHLTHLIQTRSYRSPEVILRTGFGTSADIWSAACVAFELATGGVLFNPVETENYSEHDDHLASMIELLGEIPNVSRRNSRNYFFKDGKLCGIKIVPYQLVKLLTEVNNFDKIEAEKFVDFLLPMFDFDPEKRASAYDCVIHSWLQC